MTDPTDIDALRDALCVPDGVDPVEWARATVELANEAERRECGHTYRTGDEPPAIRRLADERSSLRIPPPSVPTEPGPYYLADGRPAPTYWYSDRLYAAVDGEDDPWVVTHTWATDAGELVRVPTWGEWKGLQDALTQAKSQRDGWAADLAAMERAHDQRRDERDAAEAERDEALAKLVRVREVVDRMCKTAMSSALWLTGKTPVVVTSHWADQLCAALEGGTDGG